MTADLRCLRNISVGIGGRLTSRHCNEEHVGIWNSNTGGQWAPLADWRITVGCCAGAVTSVFVCAAIGGSMLDCQLPLITLRATIYRPLGASDFLFSCDFKYYFHVNRLFTRSFIKFIIDRVFAGHCLMWRAPLSRIAISSWITFCAALLFPCSRRSSIVSDI